jgi:hypothetical protein
VASKRRLRRKIHATCDRKNMHSSPGSAYKAMKSLHSPDILNVYKCPVRFDNKAHWHFGHPPGTTRKVLAAFRAHV